MSVFFYVLSIFLDHIEPKYIFDYNKFFGIIMLFKYKSYY